MQVYRTATWVIAGTVFILLGTFVITSRKAPPPPGPTPLQVKEQVAKIEDDQWTVVSSDKISIISGALKAGAPNDPHVDYAAKVKNSSNRAIDKLALRIRLYDCPGKPPLDFEGCQAIDEDIENIPAQLGPLETGDVVGRFQFHHIQKTIGNFAIRPEISRVRAASNAASAH